MAPHVKNEKKAVSKISKMYPKQHKEGKREQSFNFLSLAEKFYTSEML